MKLFGEWIGRCLASVLSAATVVLILRFTNIMTIPNVFIFYFGIIDGTIWLGLYHLAHKIKSYIGKDE